MKKIKLILRWAATVAYAGFVFHVLSMATGDRPTLPYIDMFYHFAIFLIMSAMIMWALRATRFRDRKEVPFIAAILATVYGSAMEIVQIYIPFRNAEWSDAIANAAGAFLAIPVVALLFHIRSSWRTKHDRCNQE